MNNQEIKKIEKTFSTVVGMVLDFVDDKVNNVTEYDKKVLRANLYLTRDNLVKDIKRNGEINDGEEINYNR